MLILTFQINIGWPPSITIGRWFLPPTVSAGLSKLLDCHPGSPGCRRGASCLEAKPNTRTSLICAVSIAAAPWKTEDKCGHLIQSALCRFFKQIKYLWLFPNAPRSYLLIKWKIYLLAPSSCLQKPSLLTLKYIPNGLGTQHVAPSASHLLANLVHRQESFPGHSLSHFVNLGNRGFRPCC